RLPEVEERRVVGRQQALLAVAIRRVAPRGQLDARAVCKDPERFHRLEAVLLLEPGEDIARLATSETVIGAAIRVDLERWRLLRMEGAEPFEHPSGLPQSHPLADELRDVDAFLDEVEITGHRSKYRATLAGATFLEREPQELLQLRRVDRLGDVVIEARLASLAPVAVLAIARERHQDRVVK